jgi:HEAT repeats
MESLAFIFSVLMLGNVVWGDELLQKEGTVVYQGKTVAQWTQDLQDQDGGKRKEAATALGNLGPDARPATNQMVTALLDEKTADIRVELVWALCQMGPPEGNTVPHLAAALNDVDARVRVWAVRALGKTHRPGWYMAAIIAIAGGNSDTKKIIKQELDANLAASRQFELVGPTLSVALKHKDSEVRLNAAKALSGFAHCANSAIPALRETLKDSEPGLRKEVQKAILEIDPAEAKRLGIETKPAKKNSKSPKASKSNAKVMSLCCSLVMLFQVGRLDSQKLDDAKALQTLRRFIDVDLTQISVKDAEAFASAMKTLNPTRTKLDKFETPRNLWEFTKKGQESCLVLLEVRPGIAHPGWDDIRITLMNSSGKSQFDSRFTTSNRCYLRRIEIERKPEDEFPIIILSTENGGPRKPGPDIKKQYFGKIHNRVDLIRLENSEQVATRNNYIYDHFRCGPPAPQQSVEEWRADLNSHDRLRILRVLTWLGGVHREAGRGEMGGIPWEPLHDIERVGEVRALASVQSRIKELTASKDKWIQQAANLALDPTDRR